MIHEQGDAGRGGGGFNREIRRYLWMLAVSFVIFAAELVGGYVSHSLALLSDAGHVFIDSLAVNVAIAVAWLVHRNRGSEGRIRAVGGYVNAALLLVIAVGVCVEAVRRLMSPPEIRTWIMITVAAFGAVGNWVQYRINETAGKDERHVTHLGVSWHLLSDLMQSVIVVLGGILILCTGWRVVDPALSLLLSFWMVRLAWKLFQRCRHGSHDGCDHHHH